MLINKAIKPDDILADNESVVELNGLIARKGSIAAFIKNIEALEDPRATADEKSIVLEMIKELVY